MVKSGATTSIGAVAVWPSTVDDAVASLEEVEVKVVWAWPLMIVPLVGITVPSVAENATATGGTNMVSEGTTLSELWVMSAVIDEVPPGVIWFGDAVVPRIIHGLESSVPVLPAKTRVPLVVPEQEAPPAPGP